MRNIRKIYIGSDHAGFELKKEIVAFLEKRDYEVTDHGAYEYDDEDDYPDYCYPVAHDVSLDPEAVGIVIGGSGQGEMIVANRVKGVRAGLFIGQPEPVDGREVPNVVELSRQHNDSNVLSLGARFLTTEEALEAVELWLETDFSGDERHIRRIQKIDQIGM